LDLFGALVRKAARGPLSAEADAGAAQKIL
jgi:hypothetical protein